MSQHGKEEAPYDLAAVKLIIMQSFKMMQNKGNIVQFFPLKFRRTYENGPEE